MKVKWGVIGCGGIAYRRTIPGMMEASNLELVAVMDVDKEATDKVAAEFNVPKKYYTEQELLTDDEIQAVYIGSPAFAHKQQVLDAAKAGKHILCEKPLGTNLEKIDKAIEMARSQRVKFGVIAQSRTYSVFKKVKKAVASGELGAMIFGDCYMKLYRSPSYYKTAGWRTTWEMSGGGAMKTTSLRARRSIVS